MVGNAFDDGKKSSKTKSGGIKTRPVNYEWQQDSKFTCTVSTSKCLNIILLLFSTDCLCEELCVCACYSS